jgi:uncharacterized protein YutE (UPF0331/DUF86 family)
MIENEVIKEKLESLRRCLKRIEDKRPSNAEVLKKDIDLQDIITVNLERAVQVSVDIASHIIANLDNSVPPSTMSECFEQLEKEKVIDQILSERLQKAVMK